MGLEGRTSHPDVMRIVDSLIESAKAHSIPFGLPTWTHDECLSYVRRGGQLLTVGSDLRYLLDSARANLSGIRRLLEEQREFTLLD